MSVWTRQRHPRRALRAIAKAHAVFFVTPPAHASDVQDLADARIVVRDGTVRVAQAGETELVPDADRVSTEFDAYRLVA